VQRHVRIRLTCVGRCARVVGQEPRTFCANLSELTLIDLKAPLKDGDRFDLTLNFEHAGAKTVKVWVQTPRNAAASHTTH